MYKCVASIPCVSQQNYKIKNGNNNNNNIVGDMILEKINKH